MPPLRLAYGCERGAKHGCAPFLGQVGALHNSAARGVNVGVGYGVGRKTCLISRNHLRELGSDR